MKVKTKILSFILVLSLLFGCVTTTVFAAAEAIDGGVITEEDVQSGDTSAVTENIPLAKGPMTYAQIKAILGDENMISNGKYAITDMAGYVTYTDADGNPKYSTDGQAYYLDDEEIITVGKAQRDFTCGANVQLYTQVSHRYMSSHSGIAKYDYKNYLGRSFVVSINIRLEENSDFGITSLFNIRTYLAHEKNSTTMTNMSSSPLYLDGKTGELFLDSKGEKPVGVSINKSTAEKEAQLTNVAIHVTPATNTYDVYVDGVRYQKNLRFLSDDQIALISFTDGVEYSYGTNGATMTFDGVSGAEDYVHSFVRVLPMYLTKYHGNSCPDTCTKESKDNTAPVSFAADQYTMSGLKSYYAPSYIECAQHDVEYVSHTHDENTLTSSATVFCNNCDGEWALTLPIDQTGNAKCDLCEISASDIPVSHTAEKIKALVEPSVTVNALQLNDGSQEFSKNGSQFTHVTENGNTYVKIGKTSKEFFTDFANSEAKGFDKIVANIQNLPTRARSFVASADLRLGKNFLAENQGFELFKACSYNYKTSDGFSLTSVLVKINADGTIAVRNGATKKYETVASLDADEFCTIAVHVRCDGTHGSYDVYIDGEYVKTFQFLTSTEYEHLNGTLTNGDASVKLNGISDYTVGYLRFLHTSTSKLTENDDVLHVDNLMFYFADKYIGAVTQHKMENSGDHKHDYSKKLVSYGESCVYCGAGEGGVAVLDANGDKFCDICVANNTSTKGAGIIAPENIASTLGVEKVFVSSGTVTKASTGKHNFGTNTSSANSAGCITVSDDGGYLKIGGKISDKNGGESYLTYTAHGKNVVSNSASAGKSFVLSIDMKLHAELSADMPVFNVMSFMAPKTVDENGNIIEFTNLQTNILGIGADGTVKYKDGANGKTQITSYKLTPGADKFTTLSVFVRPSEGDYGLYTVYANGEAITGDVQFLTEGDLKSITWTHNGYTSDGAEDYILGSVRAFQLYSTTALQVKGGSVTDTMISVDNPKLYYAKNFVECAKHSFTLSEHTHDLDEGKIVATASCLCGAKQQIALPLDTVKEHVCDSCQVFILGGAVEVLSRQVILGDKIEMKLRTKIASSALESKTAELVATYGDKTVTFPTSELVSDENGVYTVTLKLTSVEMAEDISFIFRDGEVKPGTYVTSVRDYAMSIINDEKQDEYTREIAAAMLNYGAYAQKYFAEKNGTPATAEDLANAYLPEADRSVADVDPTSLDAYALNVTECTTLEATLNAAKLVLKDTVSMKIYFSADADFTVTVDGRKVEAYKEGDEYFVLIEGVLPESLSTPYNVTVATETGKISADISVLSCVDALLAEQTEGAFADLGRAIYLFNLMARLYTASGTEATVVVKNGAKGTAALVLDDGGEQAATFATDAMQKYTNIEISFALNTKKYAAFVKDSEGNYVLDENGKFTYTQTDDMKDNAAYWTDEETGVLNKVDNNGKTLRARIELVSHSHTHAMPKDGNCYAELLGARHILEGLFGYNSPTLVTPGGFDKTDEYNNVKMEVYIAARGTTTSPDFNRMLATVEEFSPEKRERIDSFMVGYNKMWLTDGKFNSYGISAEEALKLDENGKADISQVEDFIDAAMATGNLAAFCFHTIVPKTYNDGKNEVKLDENGNEKEGGLHIYEEQADAIFAYVEKYAATGELWSTTFSTACKYYSEWNTSKLDARVIGDIIAVSLTDREDNEIFDEELTVKVSIPDSWEGATVGGETLEIKGEAGARYVLVNILPDSGLSFIERA